MIKTKINFILHKNISIAIVSTTIAMLLLFSCNGEKKNIGEAITERDSLPMMRTLGLSTLISDSGIIRYRIEAEEWLIYDKKTPPYQAFEKGAYLEQFDTLFNIDMSIKADTAYYYDKQKLWKLMGNVDIKNIKGERFNTELLFWDEAKQKIYSDKFIRIEQADRIISGYGFTSNQQMTIYDIDAIEGIFYIDEDDANIQTDSIK